MLAAAARTERETLVALPFPAIIFGVIAISLFVTLALITWSYRDVANRHEHKVKDSKANH